MILLCAFINNIKLYFLTYGFGFGLGQSFLLVSTSSILPHYFKRRLSLANGLMNFVGALISIILPVLTNEFLERYTLRETFYLLAGLNFLTVLMSFSYKSRLEPSDKNISKCSRIKSSFRKDVFKNNLYKIWCLSSFILMIGYLMPIVNIVTF